MISSMKSLAKAFASVADAAMNCNSELNALTEKYSPNRAERRSAEKQNSKNFNRNAAYHGNKGKHH